MLSVVSYQFSVREEEFVPLIFPLAAFAIPTFASCFVIGVAAPDFQLSAKFA
jgi:hypothetical protein